MICPGVKARFAPIPTFWKKGVEPEAVKSIVGNNIRRLMRMHGYDESALAERVGKSRDTIERWISGETRVNVEHVALLCEALHAPPTSLFETEANSLEMGYRAAVMRMRGFLDELESLGVKGEIGPGEPIPRRGGDRKKK